MQSPNDVIAAGLANSQALLKRYTADLAPAEYLHRPASKANCAAWTIGHLILTERQALAALGVSDPPPLPDGFDKRFSREEGCPQAEVFGDASILMPLFEQHRKMLIDAINRAPLDLLNKSTGSKHPFFATVGDTANFMALHTAMHAGQITLIRRSLGRPPIM